MEVGGQRHAPAALIPGKRACTNFTGGWVGPEGRCGKPHPAGIRSPDRPTLRDWPYRLSYPGPRYKNTNSK